MMQGKLVRKNVSNTIGNTPLVHLQYLQGVVPGKVYGKLESFNPGLSIKDRIVRHMIYRAEQNGVVFVPLKPQLQ